MQMVYHDIRWYHLYSWKMLFLHRAQFIVCFALIINQEKCSSRSRSFHGACSVAQQRPLGSRHVVSCGIRYCCLSIFTSKWASDQYASCFMIISGMCHLQNESSFEKGARKKWPMYLSLKYFTVQQHINMINYIWLLCINFTAVYSWFSFKRMTNRLSDGTPNLMLWSLHNTS